MNFLIGIKFGIFVTKSLIVEKNFTKASNYYHLNAVTQKKTANKLLNIIKKNTLNRTPKNILEIGCGTGFLTDGLFNSFQDAQFTITDISEKMLYTAEFNTQNSRKKFNINADFIKTDITNPNFDENYHLISSSLVFQWITNFDELIVNLKSILKENGFLCFATLSDSTFKNLKNIFLKEKISYPGPLLLSENQIKNICLKHFPNATFQNDTFFEKFTNIKDCLKHINKTGAGNATGSILPPGILKNLFLSYNKNITINYDIVYAVMQNKE